jgi:hypothetical protein
VKVINVGRLHRREARLRYAVVSHPALPEAGKGKSGAAGYFAAFSK